ncbi:tRNA methyltransferase 10 homolog A-like [Argiope bruennichi]|uniref:tRNA methyltransferase 10 homolog A-like n=1 Tax=Argiope bruennichi TaxID=94029 RepID=UPI00249476EB|nr:tRNA methyltransferase 10 homolog A-like [Argiope bruennichi]
MTDNEIHKQESVEVNTELSSTQPVISKNQLKKLKKHQRWLETKAQRKAKEKLKRKLKIQEAKEMGRDLGPSRKYLKSQKMCDSTCKLKICFDLSFADVMTEPEFSKAFKQLHRCYSINRRAPAPLQLYITGYSDATKQKMSKMSGCFNWDINFNSSRHTDIFEKKNIIYLTSDSPNVIDELDNDKVYIIGALVDHNRLKNICYDKAVEDNVGHARLPLDMYFKFKTRTVITIDQVYLIFLRLTQGKTWIDAIMDIVPKRKGIELKENSDESAKATVEESQADSAVENNSSLNVVENNNENSCEHSDSENNETQEEEKMKTDI